VVKEYIEAARQDGLRPRSLDDINVRLARFHRDMGDRVLSSVTRSEVDGWLTKLSGADGEALSRVTCRNYRRVCHGLFSYALDKGYIRENPFSMRGRTRRGHGVSQDERMPEVLTVDECERLLRAATRVAPEMLPSLAVQMFCGIRTAEAAALDWSAIDFNAGRLTVSPKIAKKRRVRHVEMSANLIDWLLPYRRQSGPVGFAGEGAQRSKFDRVRKAANLSKWPANGLRHSFASYHLAQHNDQNKTALLLGHRSSDVLFNHYRGLVTADDAARFWSIRPCTTAVSMMPVSAAS